MKLPVYDQRKQEVGTIDVPAAWAGLPVNTGLVFNAVQAVRTNQRRGTVATKTRAAVRGSGRKPYRQKGTGRARHGTYSSPLFVGGGISFGPQPKSHHDALPKRQRQQAAQHAWSWKLQQGQVLVVDGWQCADGKTRGMAAALRALGIDNAVLVLDAPDTAVVRAARNIPHITVRQSDTLCAADMVAHDRLVVTRGAFDQLRKRWAA